MTTGFIIAFGQQHLRAEKHECDMDGYPCDWCGYPIERGHPYFTVDQARDGQFCCCRCARECVEAEAIYRNRP
jgi:hypothetical protein